LPPTTSGFGGYILGNFARSFCQEVDTRYANDGLSYRIRAHSDQIRCPDKNIPDGSAGDSALRATA
jgi:hypothetical protein